MTLRLIDISIGGVAVVLVTTLAGCAGLSMNALKGMQYHETRVVRGEKAEVFSACRAALEAMHFEYQRGSAGSERLEMQGGMQPGGTAEALRQRQAKVTVKSLGGNDIEVAIGFWEYSEDVSLGGTVTASGKLLRGGILYEVFWSTLADYQPGVPDEEDEPVGAPEPAVAP